MNVESHPDIAEYKKKKKLSRNVNLLRNKEAVKYR